MKILFISRAYPPIVGGIENQNYELSVWLGKYLDVETVANRKGKKFLPIFLPFSSMLAILEMKNYDALLLGDGVLGLVGWIVKLFYKKKPVICVIHGLDLTYEMSFYQKLWVGFFLKKIDKFIAVGNETVKIALEKGFPKEKVVFIPNGVDTEKLIGNYSKKDLENILKINLEGKKVILTSGRLAKRKGVAWFVENVMPKLSENIIYIVAGSGPDKENIEKTIEKQNLSSRVNMLGYVTDEVRNILMNTCDIFVQPNIKIEGDMEGFGISVIEAASCKLPVIASDLEGLKDAIKNNENGFLIKPNDINGYVEKINSLLANNEFRKSFGEKARQYVIENYKWEFIASKYADEIKKQITA